MNRNQSEVSLRSVRQALRRRKRRVLMDDGAMFRASLAVGCTWGILEAAAGGATWFMAMVMGILTFLGVTASTLVLTVVIRLTGILRTSATAVAFMGVATLCALAWARGHSSAALGTVLLAVAAAVFFPWQVAGRRRERQRGPLAGLPDEILERLEGLPDSLSQEIHTLLGGALKDYGDLRHMVEARGHGDFQPLMEQATVALAALVDAVGPTTRTQRIASERPDDAELYSAAIQMTESLNTRAAQIHQAVAAIIPDIARAESTEVPNLSEHLDRLRVLAELRAEFRLDERGL